MVGDSEARLSEGIIQVKSNRNTYQESFPLNTDSYVEPLPSLAVAAVG